MYRAILIALTLVTAPAYAAEAVFDIRLAGATLGQIAVADTAGTVTLTTVMDSTPMGVGDGRFDATFVNGAYRSLGQSPGERRRIDMDFDGARVSSVTVDPVSEATDASQPSAVPAGVLDPARGFARIALASDCVAGFRLYDGRRIVVVTPQAREQSGDGTIACTYDYRVTGGPGHLSPFRFRTVSMAASYAQNGARDIALRAGPFTVRLVKR